MGPSPFTYVACCTRTAGTATSQAAGVRRRPIVRPTGRPHVEVAEAAVAVVTSATAVEASSLDAAIEGPRPTSRTGSPVTGVARIGALGPATTTLLASPSKVVPAVIGPTSLVPTSPLAAPGLVPAVRPGPLVMAAQTTARPPATTSGTTADGTSGTAASAEAVALTASPTVGRLAVVEVASTPGTAMAAAHARCPAVGPHRCLSYASASGSSCSATSGTRASGPPNASP